MRRHNRRAALAMLVFLLAGLFAGCLAGVPLDEYSYVLSIGVDAGETQNYYVSFLIQLEGAQQTETGQGEMVIAAEGDSLFEAVSLMQLALPDKLNFMRTTYIAFSQEVAKTQRMADFLGAAVNELGISRSVKLFVVLGNCNEYFKGLNSPTEPSVPKRQHGIYRTYAEEGLVPVTNLALYRESASGGRFDVMLPVGSTDTSNEASADAGQGGESGGEIGFGTTAGVNRDGGLRSYPWGCAVFSGETLAGVLNGTDTQLLLMGAGRFQKGRFAYQNDHSEYVFLLETLRKTRVELTDGEPLKARISLVLTLRAESDTAGDINDIWEKSLKGELEARLEAELLRAFELCRQMNADTLGLGRYASMRLPRGVSFEEYDWKGRYQNMQVEFHVNVKPENTMIAQSRG